MHVPNLGTYRDSGLCVGTHTQQPTCLARQQHGRRSIPGRNCGPRRRQRGSAPPAGVGCEVSSAAHVNSPRGISASLAACTACATAIRPHSLNSPAATTVGRRQGLTQGPVRSPRRTSSLALKRRPWSKRRWQAAEASHRTFRNQVRYRKRIEREGSKVDFDATCCCLRSVHPRR